MEAQPVEKLNHRGLLETVTGESTILDAIGVPYQSSQISTGLVAGTAESLKNVVARGNFVKDLCANHVGELIAGARRPRPGRRKAVAGGTAKRAAAPKRPARDHSGYAAHVRNGSKITVRLPSVSGDEQT